MKIIIYWICTIHILLYLSACTDNRYKTHSKNKAPTQQFEWYFISTQKNSKKHSNVAQIEVRNKESFILASMTCKKKTIDFEFKLENEKFTTTVVYVPESSKWVMGTFFSIHTNKHFGRPQHLAIQRTDNLNIYDLSIPFIYMNNNGTPEFIEANFLSGGNLLIPIDKVASSLINNCLKMN